MEKNIHPGCISTLDCENACIHPQNVCYVMWGLSSIRIFEKRFMRSEDRSILVQFRKYMTQSFHDGSKALQSSAPPVQISYSRDKVFKISACVADKIFEIALKCFYLHFSWIVFQKPGCWINLRSRSKRFGGVYTHSRSLKWICTQGACFFPIFLRFY